MATLSGGDAERLLRFVADAEGVGGDQPFTPDVLTDLGRLVQADWIAYSELDEVRTILLVEVERPGDEYGIPFPDPLWHEIADTHPVRAAHRSGHVGALKISDFLSRGELRRSLLYEWLQQYGVEHSLEVRITHSRWLPRTFHFDRFDARDFGERDRLVLDTLQPHLTRLWRQARTRRLLHAALSELNRTPGNGSRGVILLDGAGCIDFASRKARRLLREFFSAKWRRRLPPEIEDWVQSGSAEPLLRRRDGRRLVVERDRQTLLLREERIAARLTGREQEVLAWVARGKTNCEIAELLWVAPSTVRKHLENVYGKLGVNTRTAAVARFLSMVDAEAS
ncbi:MAG TPA: LuxR C-terminal-related transcriptional regulator [Gaiellaceae bacterium]|nr:LuxR C-terminal-related transcriptional regulator [Gaiellaceae bacterium]